MINLKNRWNKVIYVGRSVPLYFYFHMYPKQTTPHFHFHNKALHCLNIIPNKRVFPIYFFYSYAFRILSMDKPRPSVIKVKHIPYLDESIFWTSRCLISTSNSTSSSWWLMSFHVKYFFVWDFCIKEAEVSFLSRVCYLCWVIRVPTNAALFRAIPFKRFDFMNDLIVGISWV